MFRYALKRILSGLICLIGVSIIIFTTVRLSGDVTDLLLPMDATEGDFERLRAELGLSGVGERKSLPLRSFFGQVRPVFFQPAGITRC